MVSNFKVAQELKMAKLSVVLKLLMLFVFPASSLILTISLEIFMAKELSATDAVSVSFSSVFFLQELSDNAKTTKVKRIILLAFIFTNLILDAEKGQRFNEA
jgi:hypothetical protein